MVHEVIVLLENYKIGKDGGIRMSKYVYPAIFIPEENGAYSVSFPDIWCCHTYGDNLAEAVLMAEDALALTLCDYENNSVKIPKVSELSNIKTPENAIVSYIACDTTKYRALIGVVEAFKEAQ